MKDLKLKTFSLCPKTFHQNSKNADLISERQPRTRIPSEASPEEFWQAMKNVIALQNQARPLLKAPRKADLPLSFSQERQWFLDRLHSGSSSYNLPLALQVKGQLNVAALESSFKEILCRHEALRTTFTCVDGRPIQVIHPNIPFKLSNLDFTTLENPQSKLEEFILEESRQPFDLTQGPLLRATLVHLSEEEYVITIVVHHIVFDKWSEGVLLRELEILYKAFSSGSPLPLPELAIQYVDFAIWQRQLLESEALKSQLDYWKEQLSGSLPVLQLPTDFAPSAVASNSGAKVSIVLSKALTDSLEALSRKEGSTLFMTLLAAFKTLLYHYCGQEDIIIGSPIGNRTQLGLQGIIGFFLNTLVLRTNLRGNPTFRQLLGRVREVALGAFAHQHLPFEKLVEELQPERDLNRTPFFDVMLNFINTPRTRLELPDCEVSSLDLSEPESNFTMTLYAEEHSGQLNLRLVYRQDLFSADRMVSLLNQFKFLLVAIVENPDFPIQDYSLVTPECHSVLPDPNTVLPEPQYESIATLFKSWVTGTPDGQAIAQGDRAWSYGELGERAEAIARMLVNQGIQPGDVVAVSGCRSFGLMASMMGVLLSGGVLLTLDRNLPLLRQQIMLQEAKAKNILYIGALRSEDEWLREFPNFICVDQDKGRGVSSSNTAVDRDAIALPELSPNDPAYIFFTSGTTGVPKGVLGSHKGLSHFLTWQRQTFSVTPQDRSAQLTGLSFDVVLRDVFLALTSGATLCLPTENEDLSPNRILPWMEREQITLLHTVPSLAKSWLLNVPSGVSLSSLRCVFFAGEPLTDTLVRRWRETFPDAGEIVNLYGPTETTMAKCCYRVPAEPLSGVQPVGWPIPETQALILAESDRLCGIGEPGEIAIRTLFRTLGYINAFEENRDRFFKNPFREDAGDLLYRTGDRGRYRPDGAIEILGRVDNEVKIAGVRIQPGEIEKVLSQHPAVRETVVIARADEQSEKKLVAYIIAQPDRTPEIDELRRFLKKQLSDYMVPSAFVMLEAFPLTPNGKIDRRALPEPNSVRQQEKTAIAARDELEFKLTKIWETVLGIPEIGVKDNFFDLGGHSLLAVRLFCEIEKTFGKDLPLATLFQAPTVEQLAKILRQQGSSVPWSSLVPIQQNGSKPTLFCVHAIGGNILSFKQLTLHLDRDRPVYGLQARGLDKKEVPFTRIEDMAAHYIEEIVTLQPHGPYFLAGHSFGGTVAFEMARQLRSRGEKVALLALLDAHCFSLDKKPQSFIQFVRIHLRNFGRLTPKNKLKYVRERVQWHIKKAKMSYKEYLQSQQVESVPCFNILEANVQAAKNYVPQVYSGRVTLLRSSEQSPKCFHDPQLGWGDFAGEGVEIHEISGPHESIMTEPYIRVLAEKMNLCLEKAEAAIANEQVSDVDRQGEKNEPFSHSQLSPCSSQEPSQVLSMSQPGRMPLKKPWEPPSKALNFTP